jgi:hypothetical protein
LFFGSPTTPQLKRRHGCNTRGLTQSVWTNTAIELRPFTQSGRGTCPGAGL